MEVRVQGHRSEDILRRTGYNKVHCIETRGFSGGIWLFWRKDWIDVEILPSHNQVLNAVVKGNDREDWLFSALYATPNRTAKSDLWNYLEEMTSNMQLLWLVAGDFNDIANSTEKWGGIPDHSIGAALSRSNKADCHEAESVEMLLMKYQRMYTLSQKRSMKMMLVIGGGEKRWPGWPGESVFRMLVPSQKVGGIIGRKGELIKKMCEETRARIKILDGSPGIAERAVMVSAKEEPNAYLPPAIDGLLRVHNSNLDGLDSDSFTAPPVAGEGQRSWHTDLSTPDGIRDMECSRGRANHTRSHGKRHRSTSPDELIGKSASKPVSTVSNEANDIDMVDCTNYTHFIDEFFPAFGVIIEDFDCNKDVIREFSFEHCSITSLAELVPELYFPRASQSLHTTGSDQPNSTLERYQTWSSAVSGAYEMLYILLQAVSDKSDTFRSPFTA
ncbi:hypothetical protein RJ639_004728 [Escallonia herrerae]|uniref:K Homology domain-containing protein n=1 Tax=Escallonia herrerae TaxID=1293975 RepID=A0AA88W3I2_9ASTE|nr:hypothetical protein RJ639_004728 [Escallonia herrerae]